MAGVRSMGMVAALLIARTVSVEQCEAPCPDTPVPGLSEGGGLMPVPAAGFELQASSQASVWEAVTDALQARLPTCVEACLMGDLNRTGTRITGAQLPQVEHFNSGFTWESGDVNVSYWIPQGITGSADASEANSYAGRRVSLVSWHYDEAAGNTSYDKGVRVSFADVTDLDQVTYRHVLLVEPVWDGEIPSFQAVPIHAGGMAWVGDLLYVADTSYGFRVFDVSRILQVSTGRSDLVGYDSSSGSYYAYDYKYVLPQVAAWNLTAESCVSVFSFVSLDRSTYPISLLAGEYAKDGIDGLLLRFSLNEDGTGLETDSSGIAHGIEAYQAGQTRMQGALSQNGTYWLSCSSQVGSDGLLYRVTPEAPSVGYSWVDGPEDLHYSPSSDNLWTLTEDAGSRYVFSVKLSDYGG